MTDKDPYSSTRMLGLVLILIPASIFWFVIGFIVGRFTGS